MGHDYNQKNFFLIIKSQINFRKLYGYYKFRMGWSHDYVYIFVSISSLGPKRVLNILQIFPFANAEIVTAAITCIFMTIFGLSLGFALLKCKVNNKKKTIVYLF